MHRPPHAILVCLVSGAIQSLFRDRVRGRSMYRRCDGTVDNTRSPDKLYSEKKAYLSKHSQFEGYSCLS
jgi:hypothetical protein